MLSSALETRDAAVVSIPVEVATAGFAPELQYYHHLILPPSGNPEVLQVGLEV